jgi:hypothetical protein
MKRLAPLLVLTALLFAVVAPARAAEPKPAEDKSPVAPYAKTLATVTGVAISPLLGTGALGIYESLRAETPEAKAKTVYPDTIGRAYEFTVPYRALIPTTLGLTTLGRAKPGTRVNLEVDVIAKYVERLLAARD